MPVFLKPNLPPKITAVLPFSKPPTKIPLFNPAAVHAHGRCAYVCVVVCVCGGGSLKPAIFRQKAPEGTRAHSKFCFTSYAVSGPKTATTRTKAAHSLVLIATIKTGRAQAGG